MACGTNRPPCLRSSLPICSRAAGGGQRGVALFAQDLSPTQRAAFRCWFNREERRYEVPTGNCIYRVLKAVPVLAFQQAIRAWQKARLGRHDGDVVVLDGKAVRGSQGTQLVGAINAGRGWTLGVHEGAGRTREGIDCGCKRREDARVWRDKSGSNMKGRRIM